MVRQGRWIAGTNKDTGRMEIFTLDHGCTRHECTHLPQTHCRGCFKWVGSIAWKICKTEKESQTYRTDFWTLWEKERVGWSKRIALKHVYYQLWHRSPVQVWCMRQVLGAGALQRPRGMGWGGRWVGDSGWGTHVNPWPIHINVWQKPLQYCKVISLQLI